MYQPQGIITAMVTAFDENEAVNEAEIRRQVNRHLEAGVNGIFCLGTNGEAYILREEEKLQIISIVVDEVKGRIPVYAGTGMPGTRETVRLSKLAKEAGADVLSVICPYFAAISQEGLYGHFAELASEVPDMPIVLYNMPARTGCNLAPATVEKLAQVPNIVAVKDSSGNFDNILQYIERTKDMEFSVLSGNDSLILWTLMAGGRGGIAAVANLYPRTMVSIYQRFMAGDMEGARSAQDSIRSIRNCFKYGNPNTVIKTAVNLMGYPVGANRKPFHYLSEEAKNEIARVLQENLEKGMG